GALCRATEDRQPVVVAGTHRGGEHSSEVTLFYVGSGLQNEDASPPLGKLVGDSSATRTGTDDKDFKGCTHAPCGNRPVLREGQAGDQNSVMTGTYLIIGI